MATSTVYAFGSFVLEPAQQRVLRQDGEALNLSPRLFSALRLFVEHPDELLDKERLMRELWPGLVVEENNLSQVVSALRRALGDEPQGSRFIQTVPRRGFRFIAKVTPIDTSMAPRPREPAATAAASSVPAHGAGDKPAPVRAPAPDAPAAEGVGAASPPLPSASRRRWLRRVSAGGTAAVLAGAGWWVWERGATNGVSAPGITLAVLPFKPLLDDHRDRLLEVGMADSLAARLSVVPGLVVRSTTSVLRYAGPTQDPLRAARELDVDWVVDGTLQRHGDRLRTTARLLRAADGSAAWSGSFDESVVDLFGVQDQISSRIALALAPRLRSALPAPLTEPGGTRHPEAYQLYLTAVWRAQGGSGDSTGKAAALLHQALVIDPAYAQAWAQLAWTHRRKLWRNDALSADVFSVSNAAARRALELAPRLAVAQAGLAFALFWFDFDWPAAEGGFRTALVDNPNEVSAHWGLARLLLALGRVDEGLTHMRLTRELDPMSPVFNTLEAAYLTEQGRLAEATARLNRAFDIAPGHGLAFEALGKLRFAEGRLDEGIAALRKAADHSDGTVRPLAVLARHLAQVGRIDEARGILQRLRALAGTRFVPPTSLAMVHASLGDAGAALSMLEEAHRVRDVRLIDLKDDPSWASLRQEPRFVELLKKMRLYGLSPGLTTV